jgi:hypothetical protein
MRMSAWLAVAMLTLVWACTPDAPEGGVPTHPSDRFRVTLAWDAPTTDAVGRPLDDLAGYRIYYSSQSPVVGPRATMIEVGDVTQYTVDNLAAGMHYFAVTALDVGGNESLPSGELQVEVGGE